jgi:hypothetical protein
LDDVGVVIRHLREYGGWGAWRVAQELQRWEEPASFRKAVVRRGPDEVELDWAHDSAWRFFPVVPDPQLGWRLHLFDMAANKALALSARSETRDYVDILELG